MNRYYFRFGANDAHRNCYHVEIAENQGKAREQMIKKIRYKLGVSIYRR